VASPHPHAKRGRAIWWFRAGALAFVVAYLLLPYSLAVYVPIWLPFAAALDRRDPDPGTAREDEARSELESAERRADAERLRVGRAQDEFDRTLHEQLDGWRAAIEKTIGKLDDQALEAVDVLARVEAERSDARGARVWLEWLARGEQPPKTLMVASPPTSHQVNRNDPRCLSLDDVIGLARGAIERSTLVAQREQAAERAREEAEYERRSAELRVRTGRL
jgi:hypothetical protein